MGDTMTDAGPAETQTPATEQSPSTSAISDADLQGLKAQAKKYKEIASRRKAQLDELQGQVNNVLADFDLEDFGALTTRLQGSKQEVDATNLSIKRLTRENAKLKENLTTMVGHDRKRSINELASSVLDGANIDPKRRGLAMQLVASRIEYDPDLAEAKFADGKTLDETVAAVATEVPEWVLVQGKAGVGGSPPGMDRPVPTNGLDSKDARTLISEGINSLNLTV